MALAVGLGLGLGLNSEWATARWPDSARSTLCAWHHCCTASHWFFWCAGWFEL